MAASTVDEVMQTELSIPIFMPSDFVLFAKQLLKTVSVDHPNLGIEDVLETLTLSEPELQEYKEALSLVRFHLSPVMMYQQVDHRIDE